MCLLGCDIGVKHVVTCDKVIVFNLTCDIEENKETEIGGIAIS